MTRRTVRLALACALVLAAAAPALAGGAAASAARAGGDIQVRYTFSLTDDPDRVRVVVEFTSMPDDVQSFRFTPDVPGLRVQSTDGFSRADGDLVWDGHSEDASVTYTAPRAPGGASGRGDERSGNGLGTAGAADWAYLATGKLTLPYSYRYFGADPGVSVAVRPGGEGVAGPTVVYLGEYRASERTVAGQTIRLVEPAAADLSDRGAVFRSLAGARHDLRVGAVDDRVTFFVTTAPIRRGGVAFPQRVPDRQDAWVRDDVAVTRPGNTWIHEYVHTRQSYDAGERMAWFTEASAEYYAGLATLRQGGVSYDRFRDHVTTGANADARLSAPGTWSTDRVPYTKGRRVLAALDARIRRATGGNATLQAVFRRMNAHEGTVTYDDFRGFVADAAGTSLDGWLDRHVRGTAAPAVPDDPALFTDPGADADTDLDGRTDAQEFDLVTSPFSRDTDDDGLADPAELDGPTDPVTADTDGDDLADGAEREHGATPTLSDSDRDGLADGAEVAFGSNPTLPDTDFDGLRDDAEREFGSDPRADDTDGDGLADPREREAGGHPRLADADGDGLDDPREARLGTDPRSRYTDRDVFSDPRELELGTDPTARDTDGDGAGDGREVKGANTDPTDPDVDGDGILDGAEVSAGTDPHETTGDVAFFFAQLL